MKALVEHITQTLPIVDERYCDPLIPNYFKVLKLVLEHRPHVEHFKKDHWHEVADFLIKVVEDLIFVLDEGDSSLSHRRRDSSTFGNGLSRSVTPSGHSHSIRKYSDDKSQQSANSSLKLSAEDIVLCVRHLHLAPNAPIAGKAQSVLQRLIELLRLSPHASRTQQAAFDCINSIVARVVTDDLGLAQDTVRTLIPMICRFWQPKASPLKDSMLILLLNGQYHFKQIMLSDYGEDFNADLRDLLEALKEDYCKRPEREQLQTEDLDLVNAPYGRVREAPLQLTAFKARFGVIKAEQPWAMLQISASIISALDVSTKSHEGKTTSIEEFDHISKRRKIASAWDDVLDRARASQGAEKVHAIQTTAFLLDKSGYDEDTTRKFLDVLLYNLSSINGNIVSWAMLSISR